jgi:hypothetical protein
MATETPKKVKNRQRRTLFLAVFATAVFVWSAVYIFDIDSSLMYDMFLMSILLLSIIVGLALVFSIGLSLLKNRNSK